MVCSGESLLQSETATAVRRKTGCALPEGAPRRKDLCNVLEPGAHAACPREAPRLRSRSGSRPRGPVQAQAQEAPPQEAPSPPPSPPPRAPLQLTSFAGEMGPVPAVGGAGARSVRRVAGG